MGYIKQSRSVNSKNAIDNYEVPLNLFTEELLQDFQLESDIEYYDIDSKVFKLPLSVWKFTATAYGASSWHHTGKYFNCTNHYDLYSIAEYLTSEYDTILKRYKAYRTKVKRDKVESLKKLKLGYITYLIWGGTRRHPKVVGRDTAYGYIDDKGRKDWLVSTDGSRFDIHANKVESLIESDDLYDFKKKVESSGCKIDLRHFKKFLRGQNRL